MATKKTPKYTPARPRTTILPGDAIRIGRELQEMSQHDLAAKCGIPQPTISDLESGRRTLGAERALKIAKALRVHPGVLLFPNYEAAAEPKKRATG
jgi:transcriptional regulator with XRE-family HTH domain